MIIERDRYKICERSNPHTILVNSAKNAPLNVFSGNVKLERRLEDIIAFKVDYFNISDGPGEYPIEHGYIRILKSAYLGGLVKDNLFSTAISTNTDLSIAEKISDIIAWCAPSVQSLNIPSQVIPNDVNLKRHFIRPRDIDSFDWAIEGLNGQLFTGDKYAFEMVIRFYPACHCNS